MIDEVIEFRNALGKIEWEVIHNLDEQAINIRKELQDFLDEHVDMEYDLKDLTNYLNMKFINDEKKKYCIPKSENINGNISIYTDMVEPIGSYENLIDE